jgi:uncharacterized membrane protein YeaQ/YmgE (transglycosylase-associated protein family)
VSKQLEGVSAMLISIIVGFVAGILAKAIMPGTKDEPSGWILTILLGIAGGWIGGILFGLLGIHAGGLIGRIIVSTLGAVVLIAALRFFKNQSGA